MKTLGRLPGASAVVDQLSSTTDAATSTILSDSAPTSALAAELRRLPSLLAAKPSERAKARRQQDKLTRNLLTVSTLMFGFAFTFLAESVPTCWSLGEPTVCAGGATTTADDDDDNGGAVAAGNVSSTSMAWQCSTSTLASGGANCEAVFHLGWFATLALFAAIILQTKMINTGTSGPDGASDYDNVLYRAASPLLFTSGTILLLTSLAIFMIERTLNQIDASLHRTATAATPIVCTILAFLLCVLLFADSHWKISQRFCRPCMERYADDAAAAAAAAGDDDDDDAASAASSEDS